MNWQFFTEGIFHILDFNGYDHMLFLFALSIPYGLKEWKQLLLLATAFTLGHSISLALSATNILHFSSDFIETLIPVTIMITALSNIDQWNKNVRPTANRCILTTAFGIVHGMGFSSYFRMLFDDTQSIFNSLLLFNLGVETGQILILAAIFIFSISLNKIGINRRNYVITTSLISALAAALLLFQAIFTTT